MTDVGALEAEIGLRLPSEYSDFLATHKADDQASLFVNVGDLRRDVRCLLDLQCTEASYSVLGMYRLVSDAIPTGTIPIGCDWAGNLYLIVCSGERVGAVLWWDHERLPGEDHVEEMSESFGQFTRNLVRGEP